MLLKSPCIEWNGMHKIEWIKASWKNAYSMSGIWSNDFDSEINNPFRIINFVIKSIEKKETLLQNDQEKSEKRV